MRSLGTAALAVALLAPLGARAQPVSATSGPDTYLALHLGAFVPQGDDLDGFDPGVAFGGTFGARFTRNLGVEGELAYYRSAGGAGGASGTLAVIPFSVSLRLSLPLKVAEVSALAGAGVHFAALSSDVGAGESTERATAFGFHAGVAGSFNLSPTMLVGAEVRRTFVTAAFADVDTKLDGLRIAVTLTYKL